MKEWQDITHYAGFDWARDHHAVVIVDSQGRIVADFEFKHSLEGWQSFQQQTAVWPNLAIAIETKIKGPPSINSCNAVIRFTPLTRWPRKVIANVKLPAAPKPITSMVGVWLTPCAWMATVGSHSSRWIR